MGLIACPECDKQVSDKAMICPYCGAPREEIQKAGERVKANRWSVRTKLILAALSLGVVASFSTYMSYGSPGQRLRYSEQVKEELKSTLIAEDIMAVRESGFINLGEKNNYRGNFLIIEGFCKSDECLQEIIETTRKVIREIGCERYRRLFDEAYIVNNGGVSEAESVYISCS